MSGHHLILGQTKDIITGETLADTHDERYRQKIARVLLSEKGFAKSDIQPRVPLAVSAGSRKGRLWVDFLVHLQGRVMIVVKYAPGSLVTRHRPTLAISRLVADYQPPYVVVTNGEDADILDGSTGRALASGFDAIPTRDVLERDLAKYKFLPITGKRAEMESRIVYAFEIDDSCPCDDTTCRIA